MEVTAAVGRRVVLGRSPGGRGRVLGGAFPNPEALGT